MVVFWVGENSHNHSFFKKRRKQERQSQEEDVMDGNRRQRLGVALLGLKGEKGATAMGRRWPTTALKSKDRLSLSLQKKLPGQHLVLIYTPELAIIWYSSKRKLARDVTLSNSA